MPPLGVAETMQRSSSRYHVIFNFSGANGVAPFASLTAVKGTLYGTTNVGGAYGYGTVFSVTPAGIERVLYSFMGGSDAEYPADSLAYLDGSFYSTSFHGGAYDNGTVFGVSTAGAERVVFSFDSMASGYFPAGSLAIGTHKKLYGVTSYGGYKCKHYLFPGCGTIYSLTTSGSERVIYKFKRNHGAHPYVGLTALPNAPQNAHGGPFYSTTHGDDDLGTAYSVTTTGDASVLHEFEGGASVQPNSPLTALDGVLYGETGATTGNPKNGGCGSIFRLTPAGKERVIFTFRHNSDGCAPTGGLTALNGLLYGVTWSGGAYEAWGTIFSVTTKGKERVLYSFQMGSDGFNPIGGLTALDGTLYGTTSVGGTGCTSSGYGCGTVFAFTP